MLNGAQYTSAPAIIMALGIFLNFAGRFLLSRYLQDAAEPVLLVLTYCLVLLAVWIFFTIFRTFRKNPRAILHLDSAHFGIGTWAAGLNVLSVAVVMNTRTARLASALNLLAWSCWVLYLVWFGLLTVRNPEYRNDVFGTAFLLTVSTQSTVIGTLNGWDAGPLPVWLFRTVSSVGLLFYLYVFFLVWIRRGLRNQLLEWKAPNNITHGALSISVLALETIGLNYGTSGFLLAVLNVLWTAATLFFAAALVTELRLLFSRQRQAIVGFHYGNYARNFTYGMYFACTYLGSRRIPGFFASRLLGEPALLGLAVLVLLVNLWEAGRHTVLFIRSSGDATMSRKGSGKYAAARSLILSETDRKISQSLFDSHEGGTAAEKGWMNVWRSVVFRSSFSYQVAAGRMMSEYRADESMRKLRSITRSNFPSGAGRLRTASSVASGPVSAATALDAVPR